MAAANTRSRKSRITLAEENLDRVYAGIRQIPEFARLTRLAEALREWKSAVKEIVVLRDEEIEDLNQQLAQSNTGNRDTAGSLDDMLAIQKMAQAIRSARSPEAIAETLRRLIEQVIDVLDAGIFIIQEETEDYTPLHTTTETGTIDESFHAYVEEGIIAWVIDAQTALVVDDLETMAETVTDDERRHYLVVPIMQVGSTMGIYLVHTRTPREQLSERQLELVTLLTEHAAGAIENLQLSARLKDIRREQSERSKV
jgi:GAF domain-containing protein